VEEHKSNIVRVIHKTAGGLQNLKENIISLINTRFPEINRCLINYFFTVQANYMREFVEPNYEKIKDIAMQNR
jgi:hypothetical protein